MPTLEFYTSLDLLKLHCVVDPASECWLWDQALSQGGYGIIYDPGTRRQVMAHRLAVQLAGRTIGLGEHTCGVTGCCNPAHLVVRSDASTTCRFGHELTVRANGSRTCRECRKAKVDEAKIRAALHRVRLGLDKGEDGT